MEIGKRRIGLTVLATSIYANTGTENFLTQGEPKGRTVSKVIPRSSLDKLADLENSGVKLGIWDIWSQIESEMKTDPRLANIRVEILAREQIAAEST